MIPLTEYAIKAKMKIRNRPFAVWFSKKIFQKLLAVI